MRIVHVVTTLDPAGGGPPHVAVRMAAAQAARGHQVHLACYAETADEARVAAQLERIPHRERVQFHLVSDLGPVERLLGRRTRRLLNTLVPEADFVHIHGLWGTILRAAAQTARKHHVPYCFRPAGMLDPWSLAQKRWKKIAALALGYRSALNGAAFLHTLNDDERRLIGPLHLRARPVVIPNGIFLEEIEPLPTLGSFRATHPDLSGSPFVLFLSRLHHKKGLDILAAAFALIAPRLPELRLVVAGPDDGGRRDFMARITASQLAGRVHLVGGLYGRDKFAALVDAACFCLPSRQEGLPVAILEALACQVPVVISEACHFPEVAREGAGTVTSLDPTDVAAALERVLTHAGEAARMGAAGAALVRERYTWEAIAQQTLDLYRATARRPPGS